MMPGDVGLEGRSLVVFLGVAGARNAEREALADERDQLVGMAKATFDGCPVGGALRRVAPEGE
ncbi:MAG: hypothetical protein JRJ64_12715, partial [Deltaproteobacteria bacterium]|nr:hypothetical protein [Deltaproteobacteria bacterium]